MTGLVGPAIPDFGAGARTSEVGFETARRVAFPPILSSVALIRLRRSVTIFAALLSGYFASVGARIGEGCASPDRLLARLGEFAIPPGVRFRAV